MQTGELHKTAWELIEPYFRDEQDKAAALYEQQAGMENGRASSDLSEIVIAAASGRVGQLFIPQDVEQWGEVDWSSGQVEFHEEQTLENEDLLDYAAVQTLINNGEVYVVAPDQLPVASTAAAVFRY
jgi:hypothetical protein